MTNKPTQKMVTNTPLMQVVPVDVVRKIGSSASPQPAKEVVLFSDVKNVSRLPRVLDGKTPSNKSDA